jgi:predicted HD phosphohydrolase
MRLPWLPRRPSSPPPAAEAPPFRAMTEGTREHWAHIAERDAAFSRDAPARVLTLLSTLRNDCHGFAVDRLEHGLQTATRAHRDGRDEEYVVCALLHDIGASIAPRDHAAFAAMILEPHVSERNHWMVRHHDVFQGYYFFHFFDGDRNARDKFKRHPHYQYTAEFCARYDQAAFDPDYDSMPLESFEPMVWRVLGQRP